MLDGAPCWTLTPEADGETLLHVAIVYGPSSPAHRDAHGTDTDLVQSNAWQRCSLYRLRLLRAWTGKSPTYCAAHVGRFASVALGRHTPRKISCAEDPIAKGHSDRCTDIV